MANSWTESTNAIATVDYGHLDGGSGKHDASEIDVESSGSYYTAADAEGAFAQLDSALASHLSDAAGYYAARSLVARVPGPVYTDTGVGIVLLADAAMTLESVHAHLLSAPSGDPVTVDVHLAHCSDSSTWTGTASVFSSEGDRPSIESGAYSAASGELAETSVAPNDRIIVYVDTASAGGVARDLTVQVRCRRYLS